MFSAHEWKRKTRKNDDPSGMEVLQRFPWRMSCVLVLPLAVVSVFPGCASDAADHVFTNGRIYTVNEAQPWADAVAVKDEEIVFVGSSDDAEAFMGQSTVVTDLDGKLMLPGFIDAHVHPGLGAMLSKRIEMPDQRSVPETIAWVADYLREHPDTEFLYAGPVPISNWDDPALGPTAEELQDLDAVTGEVPVALHDVTAHGVWFNSRAMELTGVTNAIEDPVPGLSRWARDRFGNLNGYAIEFTLFDPLAQLLPTPVALKEMLSEFLDAWSAAGYTALFDGGNGPWDDIVYRRLAELDNERGLPLTYEGTFHVTDPSQLPIAISELSRLRASYTTDNLSFNTIKIHLDGEPSIGGVALFDGFPDDPNSKSADSTRGATLVDEEALIRFMADLHTRGDIDLHVHAVGDRTIHVALNAYERSFIQNGGTSNFRMTICHLTFLHPDDLPRFAELGVMANYTAHWFGGYGIETRSTEAFQRRGFRVLDVEGTGATITISTDVVGLYAIDRASALFGIQAMHNRQEPTQGRDALPLTTQAGEQRMSIESLVRAFTLNNAHQLNRETQTGSIEVGKRGDLVVLERNIFTMNRYAIAEAGINITMHRGRITFRNQP